MRSRFIRHLLPGACALIVCTTAHSQTYWGALGMNTSTVGNLFAAYASDDGQRLYLGGSLDFDLVTPGWDNMLVKCPQLV